MKNCTALVLLACIAACSAIVWVDCGSKGSKVKSVQVTGCDKSKICDLPRGENVTFTVDFKTSASSNSAKSVVHGLIDRIPLPFPIKHPDACTDKDCGIVCPIKDSKSYSFHPKIYVNPSFPKVKAIVKWELKNSNNDDIFCVMVSAQIVDAKKTKDQNRTKPKHHNSPSLFQLL